MFIFGSVSLIYMLAAFKKLNDLSRTFNLIETENGLISFYVANFFFMQMATLVYGVTLMMMSNDLLGLDSCGELVVAGFLNLMWNLPAVSTCTLMAVTISRLSKPTFF